MPVTHTSPVRIVVTGDGSSPNENDAENGAALLPRKPLSSLRALVQKKESTTRALPVVSFLENGQKKPQAWWRPVLEHRSNGNSKNAQDQQ
jgi:hypothetical protein